MNTKVKEKEDILEDASQDYGKVLDIHIGDRVLFFGRLSDITRLPDWFKEDEERDAKRFDEKWNYFLMNFRQHGITDIFPSQWFKFLLSKSPKDERVWDFAASHTLVGFLEEGLGKLVLVDGYPKETLMSFARNLGVSIKIWRDSNNTPPIEELYIPTSNNTPIENFVKYPTRMLYVNSVENHEEIGGWRTNIRQACEDYKTHFIDITEEGWVKKRLPIISKYYESVAKLEEIRTQAVLGKYGLPPGEGTGMPPIGGGGGVQLN